MSGLRTLLFSLVGAIILLHTLVPHEHQNRQSQITIIHNHECTTNLFGEIQLSFGVDHGEGHFEHFFKIPQDTPSPQLIDVLTPVLPEENTFWSVELSTPVHYFLFIPPDPLRGPPSILA